jgi:titin
VITGSGATTNVIQGNFIGTNPKGITAVPNTGDGIDIVAGASANTVGGTTAPARNIISSNLGNGIVLQDATSSGNVVEGNFVGVDSTGLAKLPNAKDGVLIQNATNNTVGGTAAGAGNVISANGSQGVEILSAPPPPPSSTSTSSESLTLTQAATTAGFALTTFASGFPQRSDGLGPFGIGFPASGGVLVDDGPGNVRRFPTDTDAQTAGANPPVSGASYGESNAEGMARVGNLMYLNRGQANGIAQINDDGTTKSFFANNVINSDAMVLNPLNGHLFVSSFNGPIFDVDPVAQTATVFVNVPCDGLTFDPVNGILYGALYSAAGPGNAVQGFDINTKAVVFDSGTIAGGPDGTALGTGALANDLLVNTNSGTVIEVNLTTKAQTVLASGGTRGDFVTVDPNNGTLLVTQSDQVARLIPPAGGGFAGGSNATGNVIQGNQIGTGSDNVHTLANGSNGVLITGSSGNAIGGSASGAGNVIAFNTGNGVRVASGTNNAVEANSIFANGKLGIDLVGGTEDSFGVTANSPGGPHVGANALQNFPTLASATASGSTAVVTGTLNSTPGQSFRLEFFNVPTADPSGHGQGETFLGTTSVTTDASGNASFTFNAPPLLVGQFVSATATDSSNNTSEFAQNVQIANAVVPMSSTSLTSTPNPSAAGQAVTVTATVSANTGAAPGGTVTFTVDNVAQSPITLTPSANLTAVATFTTSALTVGSHTITATYSGLGTLPGGTSNTVTQVVTAATAAPTVTTVQRFGFHMRPTSIVLTFSQPLNASSAQNLANYQLILESPDGSVTGPGARTITITSAVYDAAAHTVTLQPDELLPLKNTYRLTVIGAPPNGVASTSGAFLAGSNGQPGTNFVTEVSRSNLVLGMDPPAGHSRRKHIVLRAKHVVHTHSTTHSSVAPAFATKTLAVDFALNSPELLAPPRGRPRP